MLYVSRRRRFLPVIGAFLVAALVLSGVWLLVQHRDGGTAEPPAGSSAPSAQPGGPEPGASQPAGPPGGPGTSGTATMTVTVFFHRGQGADPARVAPVRRTVPRTSKVATASLHQLLSGPTAAERRAGYWSLFTAATAGMLHTVRVSGGVGYADFRDLRKVIPNAGSSAGSTALLAELDATFEQFRTVRTTVYSINGDVEAFYAWLQREAPEGPMPPLTEARRVARDFLTRVVGMSGPVFRASQWRSDFVATVDFRSRAGGPVTTVALGRGRTSFTVLDATTDTIRVDTPRSVISPSDRAVIGSPVTVAGAALAFEGTVNVRVLEVAGGAVRHLGSGYVTGGGDVMRPFSGTVSFVRPSAGTGWVVAFERSAANGAVTKATAVEVAFRPSS